MIWVGLELVALVTEECGLSPSKQMQCTVKAQCTCTCTRQVITYCKYSAWIIIYMYPDTYMNMSMQDTCTCNTMQI